MGVEYIVCQNVTWSDESSCQAKRNVWIVWHKWSVIRKSWKIRALVTSLGRYSQSTLKSLSDIKTENSLLLKMSWRSVRANQNNKAGGYKTKTMRWKKLKCSTKLSGPVRVGRLCKVITTSDLFNFRYSYLIHCKDIISIIALKYRKKAFV